MNKKLIIAWMIALNLQLIISAFAQDNLIPQEIEFEGVTYSYDPHWKESESIKKGDFDGDGVDEIIVSFETKGEDGVLIKPFYLIYDIEGGKEKLVKTIIGSDYLGEIRIIDLGNDGPKGIVIFTYGGMHRTDVYVYRYKDGAYECIFHSYDGLAEVDDKDGKSIIKRAWPKRDDSPQCSRYDDCYWAVYAWNGEKFVYSSELSDISETSEEEERQWYLDMLKSLNEY